MLYYYTQVNNIVLSISLLYISMANLINLSLAIDRTNENRDIYNFENRVVENRVIENEGIEHDSDPETDHEDQESSISDCESMVVGKNECEFQSTGEKLVMLNEEDQLYKTIAGRLLLSLGNLGFDAQVEKVCRNFFTGFTYQARFHSFRLFQKALEKKSGGANVKYAWYGATKDEVYKILTHGFGHFSRGDETQVSYGTGVYLSPFYAPLERLVIVSILLIFSSFCYFLEFLILCFNLSRLSFCQDR